MKSHPSLFCVVFLGLNTLIIFSEINGKNGAACRKVNYRSSHFSDIDYHHMRYRKRKPTLRRPLQNATAYLGKTAVFRCMIDGPPSRIRWRKNKIYVPHSRRFRTRSYSWGGLLRIRPVKVSDYGVYTCKARNSLGQVTSNNAQLIIKGVDPALTERCERYTGSLCSSHLQNTAKSLISFGETQRAPEKKIRDTFRRMSSFVSPECKKHLLHSLCKHHFPPCDPTSSRPRRLPICKEDCLQLQKQKCRGSFTIAKAMSLKLRRHLPICYALPKANRENKPTNCQKIFFSKSGVQESGNSENYENNAEILKTLFTIIRGIPQHNEGKESPKSRDLPVEKSKDNQELKGTCELYVGKVCSQHIQVGQKIFISETRTQLGYETRLTKSLPFVIPFTSPQCRQYALKALCYYFFPPCLSDNKTPKLMCRRDCEVLEARVCSKEFQYAMTMPVAGEIIPHCSFLPVKQDTCLELGLPDEMPETLPTQYGCSLYAMSQNSRGKLVPSRPTALQDSSPWCKNEVQATSFGLIPAAVRKTLKQFGGNGAIIGHSQLLGTKGETLEYCVKLRGQTPQKLLKSSYMETVTLPNMIRPDPKRVVPGLVVKLNEDQSHGIEIPIGFIKVYRPHKFLKLNDVLVLYLRSKTHNTFVGRGRYELCGTNFSVEIKRTKYDSVRMNGQSPDPVDVNTIERAFGVAEPASKLLEILKKYGVFLLRLMRPNMEMYVGEALSAKFSGISFVENLKTNARTEILAGKLRRNYLLSTGLIFEDVPLGKIVFSFSGVYIKYLDILQAKNNKSKVGLSLSAHTVDLANTPFLSYTSEPLASAFTTSIPRGLYFAAKTGTPKNCMDGQTLCKLLQVVLGKNTDFTLTGQTSWQWAHFKASIQNTAIKNHLPVEKVDIEMKATNKTGMLFGVQPYLAYRVDGDVFVSNQKRHKLVFTGTLFYSNSGRQLAGRIKTNAVWKKAFGYPQLTMKRMQAWFSIRLVRPYFPNKLETKADFEVGLYCNNGYESDCITGTAYVGMSDEVNEQYFHGIISRFTIQDILRVHGVQARLPAHIATIGFPDGLEITFAKESHNLEPIGGPMIKPGFTMRGRIRVLGLESDCSVYLKPNEFMVDADVNGNNGPIKLGGVTPLYRSRHDRKNGPKLHLETRFSPTPYVKAYIDGYTRIFGVFDEIRILLTRRHFKIRLVTSIFKSFKVRINVMANYSEDLGRTHFKAKVVFIGGLAKLTRATSKHVIKILRNEKMKLESAKTEMRALRSECRVESKKICDDCLRSSSCRSKLLSCRSNLKTSERRVYGRSSTKHFCQRLLRDNCGFGQDNCKFVCKNTSIVNHSCKSFDQSQRTVEDIRRSLFWVSQARAILSSNVCRIHSITFSTRLRPDDIGDIYVNARLDVTLFGRRQRIDGVRLKFGIFARLASDIARQAVEWYRKSQR